MLPGAFGTRILLALLLLISLSAHAAGPLTAEIKPVALRARAFAPEALDVKLNWSGSGLLEGALEFSFPGADENAPLFRSQDLALTSGLKEFRMMLPASFSNGVGFSREVSVRFLTKTTVLDLGRTDLGTQRGAERNFTICVVRPKLARAPGEFALWQSLRLERFQPETNSFQSPTASTFPVHTEPEEMPATPLAYTAYDIVLLEDATLAQLREKQLAALSRWVLAGGSLCVIASAPLETVPRNFLTELLAADPRAPGLDFDAEGRAQVKEEGGVALAWPGFGRLVVAIPGPHSDAGAGEMSWKRAATFLWKFRESQVDLVLETGTWTVSGERPDPWRRSSQRQQLAYALAPQDVRILPYPLMLLLLAVFVLLIGPGDWLLLGRFRLRRFTWIFFPLVALVFTAVTVALAAHYTGRSNYRSRLILTDLGHDGRVLRETRFEMIFPAQNQEVKTDVRNALWAPVSSADLYGNQARRAPASCEGLFPTSFVVRQALSQWSPQINRLTSLEGGRDESGIDWAALDPRDTTWDAFNRIGSDISQRACCLTGGHFLIKPTGLLPEDFVRELCQPQPFGWLGVCSQLSPNGASDFEDLALAGVKDTNVSAIIIARREGENIHIYRHLYAP